MIQSTLRQRLLNLVLVASVVLGIVSSPQPVAAETQPNCVIAVGAREGIYWADPSQRSLTQAGGNDQLGENRWQVPLGWSGNGEILYTQTQSIFNVPIYAFSTDEVRQIASPAIRSATLSLDGQFAVYFNSTVPLTADLDEISLALEIITLASGATRKVAPLPTLALGDETAPSFSRPFFSPDHAQIGMIWVDPLAADVAQLMLFDADSGQARVLANLPYAEWAYADVPHWSPDGQYIALTLQRDFPSATPASGFEALFQQSLVYLVEVKTGEAILLSEDADTPRWTGDGAVITYRQAGTLVFQDVNNLQQTPTRYALPQEAIQISISPSGKYAAYTQVVESRNPIYADQLVVMDLATGDKIMLKSPRQTPQLALGIVWQPSCAAQW